MSPPSWWIGFDWNDEYYYNSHNTYSSRLPLSSLSSLNPGRVRTSWSCICRGKGCFRKGHMAPNINDSSSPLGCFHMGDGGSWLNILPFLGPHLSENLLGSYYEGNGNPLQYFCLENPRDRGAYWAAVYGVAQSQTWLTRLSSLAAWSRHCASSYIWWRN